MTEPIYPYIKSKEEIEYEKRILLRRSNITSIKRMKLEQFKKSLENNHIIKTSDPIQLE